MFQLVFMTWKVKHCASNNLPGKTCLKQNQQKLTACMRKNSTPRIKDEFNGNLYFTLRAELFCYISCYILSFLYWLIVCSFVFLLINFHKSSILKTVVDIHKVMLASMRHSRLTLRIHNKTRRKKKHKKCDLIVFLSEFEELVFRVCTTLLE